MKKTRAATIAVGVPSSRRNPSQPVGVSSWPNATPTTTTDVLASVAFAVPWLLVTLRLVGDRVEAPARPARRAEPVGGTR